MFPNSNSTPVLNEAGEVLGWDTYYDDALDVEDYYEAEDETPYMTEDYDAWNEEVAANEADMDFFWEE